MAVRFVGQPFTGGGQIGAAFTDALRAPGARSLWIATAWGKRSGVGRIRDAVIDFRANGGACEVIVGIDEGGATREGLEICLDIFDHVFIYHDPGTRTFHPKIYAVESPDHATIIVGSGNLTKGGLFTNYEAALVLDVDRNAAEWDVRDEARAYFDALLGAGEAIRSLDAALIDVLATEGWVTSEATQNRRRAVESRGRRQRQRLFGNAVAGLAGAPAPNVPALPDEEDDEDSPPPPAPPVAPAPVAPAPPAPTAPATVVASWDKEMSHADAQHPARVDTNPTGRLGLGQAGHDIDHRTWFRNELFGGATWAWSTDRNGNDIEEATVPFEVTINGTPQGQKNLKLSHAEHRESTRGSVITILHWGELAPTLRATDYTGRTVTLRLMSDASFSLEIS